MKQKRILGCILTFALTITVLFCGPCSAFASSHFPNTVNSRSSTSRRLSNAQRGTPRRRARTYDVLHYVIKTKFDVPNKTVHGEVDISLKPLSNNFNVLELDATNLKIERVSLSSGKVLRSITRSSTLRITLDRSYDPSDSITVNIKYRTRPTRGLYFISPSDNGGFDKPAHVWTQGEPEDNHYWFPCYDFPDDKATSEQYITTGGNQLAISNGKLVDTVSNPNGTRTFHWTMDKAHSSYLISLIVGDYVKLTGSYKNIDVEYYTYRGTESQALGAFDITPTIMGWYSHVLNSDFPYPRYAQTVVGDFIFGGMENITATTFADTEILSGDGQVPDSATINLVSHELAHSWFGNLVTCKDWGHLWLNEGFATFMEASFREHRDGRDGYLAELKEDAQLYFQEDASRKRHPLVNPNYPLGMDLFDETTYKKGALVVHMLRETVGDEVFWRAINTYLNEYKYRTVDSRDLQSVFERVSGQSLDWFFDQWVYKAGYPELVVRSKYSPLRRQLILNVTQTHKSDYMTPAVFRLPVEIEIITADGSRTENIEINRRTQDFTFHLDSRPLSVTFDKRSSVLKKLTTIPSRSVAAFPILDGADSHPRFKIVELFSDRYVAMRNSMKEDYETISHLDFLRLPFASPLFERFDADNSLHSSR